MVQSPTIWHRVFWSFGCVLLGAGLVGVLPLMMMWWVPRVVPRPFGQDWSGLLVLMLCTWGSLFCGLGGAIAGGWKPGRPALAITMGCVLAVDVFSLLFCQINSDGSRFVFMYFVLAAFQFGLLVLMLMWRLRHRLLPALIQKSRP